MDQEKTIVNEGGSSNRRFRDDSEVNFSNPLWDEYKVEHPKKLMQYQVQF